jgi:hypothetical protein
VSAGRVWPAWADLDSQDDRSARSLVGVKLADWIDSPYPVPSTDCSYPVEAADSWTPSSSLATSALTGGAHYCDRPWGSFFA